MKIYNDKYYYIGIYLKSIYIFKSQLYVHTWKNSIVSELSRETEPVIMPCMAYIIMWAGKSKI